MLVIKRDISTDVRKIMKRNSRNESQSQIKYEKYPLIHVCCDSLVSETIHIRSHNLPNLSSRFFYSFVHKYAKP